MSTIITAVIVLTEMKVEVAVERPVASFFAVMFAWSWGYWALVGATVDVASVSFLVTWPGLWGPVVSAVVVTWARGASVRGFLGQTLRTATRTRWYVVAVVAPALFGVVGSVIQLGLTDAGLELAVLSPAVGLAVALFAGGSEEIGLRGFAHSRLRRRHGGLQAGLLIGVIWAVWHLPLQRLGVGFDGSFLLFAASAVPISVLLGWLYDAGSGSVLPAVVAHAGFDAPELVTVAGQVSDDVVFTSQLVVLGVYWLLVVGLVAKNGVRLTGSPSLPGPTALPTESAGDETRTS